MLRYAFFVLFFSVLFSRSSTAQTLFGYENPEENLLSNWDLEDDINGVDIYMACATGRRVPVSNTGEYSYLVQDRSKFFCSLRFKVNSQQLKKNTNYYVSLFVKLANNPVNEIYSTVTFVATYKLVNSTKPKYLSIGQLRFQRYNDQWQQIGGDFKTPDSPFQAFTFFLSVKPADVNYYIDTLSLIKLGDMSNNWKEVLSAKIDNIRKENVTLNVDIGQNFIPGNTTVQIRQQTHHFRFGSALSAYNLLRNDSAVYENYRNFSLKYFNWAGFVNAFKWRMMEMRERGIINFDVVDRGLDFLDSHNVPVRAHTIVWDRMANSPAWLSQYNGTLLVDEIYRRVDYLVEHYKNRVVEWDVNNEYLHEHDYEIRTGELDLLCKLFRRVKNIDQNAKLCTNDYELVKNGRMTSAAVNLARDLQTRHCGVGCFGVQSHLRYLPVAIEVLQKRMEILCSARLPISVTEFSVHSDNVTLRAEELEKAFYVYFSQDCVQSILLWGFSDQPGLVFTQNSVLTTGPDFIPNEAGQKMIDLITKVWNTTFDINLDEAVSSHKFKALHGSYKLILSNGERILYETNFQVRKGVSTTLDISVGVC